MEQNCFVQNVANRFPCLPTVLSQANPYQDWRIDQRYAADGSVNAEGIGKPPAIQQEIAWGGSVKRNPWTMTVPCFDQALPAVLTVLKQRFGETRPETTVVRDALGILFIVLPDDVFSESDEWNSLAACLHEALGRYSPGDRRVLLRISDLIDEDDIIQSPDRVRLPEEPNTSLLDRLQTNQDWLRKPLVLHPPLPTAVAFSIKGGVGRTTAFALWAWTFGPAWARILY